MTRGRRPLTALREAKRIAEKRGDVRHFAREREMICNFAIFTPCYVAFVRIKRVRRLRNTPAQLERDTKEDLAVLRSIAYVAGISRELWICSPKGSFRFFRVTDPGLIELGRDGLLVPEPVQSLAGNAGPSPHPAPVKNAAAGAAIPEPISEPPVRENTLPEGREGGKPTL